VAAILTLTVGLVLGALAGRGDGDEPAADLVPTPTLAVSLPDLQPPPSADELQRAEVVKVIDGDTIRVRIPSLRSGQAGPVERVRYYGVDTPERGDRCFEEATARNEALVGDRVLLLPDARERDDFDRLLRYVFTEDGESLEARLIAEGLGVAWRQDGAYRDELVALEEEVRALGVGCLWEE
jgi:micrococcal nuclease